MGFGWVLGESKAVGMVGAGKAHLQAVRTAARAVSLLGTQSAATATTGLCHHLRPQSRGEGEAGTGLWVDEEAEAALCRHRGVHRASLEHLKTPELLVFHSLICFNKH